jgi:aminopeptidase
LKPQETVLIRGSDHARPLINEVFKECLLSDAYPIVMPMLDLDYTFYVHAKEHQLKFVSAFEKLRVETIDAQISIRCETNPKALTTIDPSKIRTHRAAWRELAETFNRRTAEGKLKWALLPYPINAQAQEAGMALEEYEDFVYRSCMVDKENPIEEWRKIGRAQEKTCRLLDNVSQIRIVGEDTDLSLRVKERKWINSDGKRNMPSGEVFTAPVEDSVDGTIRFTYPGIYAGREVENITLTFEAGRVISASAAKGSELLQEIIKIEGADRLGEVAVGTNYGINKFTKNMLFDEKMGGTIHMALGNSYPESGGLNRSAIHWDVLKDMKKGGEIYADGKLVYKDGEFLEDFK